MVLVTAAFEASLEWMRRGGSGSLMDLVTKALDITQVGARLDELQSRTARS